MKEILYNRQKVLEYAQKWAYDRNPKYNKSPSWSGVEFLYNFLTKNKMSGPYGKEVSQDEIKIGDIAQLSFDGNTFGHTLVIVKIENKFDINQIFISSHTFDSFNKRISEYNFEKIRFVHIEKVRK